MLTIGLINNMRDMAMHSAERQICALLAAASAALTVQLKLFAPPDALRSSAAQSHVDDFYEPFEMLEEHRLDGLIVTGAEPQSEWLEDEPSWPTLSRIVDFAELTETPVLWSCMAAHAAAYRLGGVHRHRLPRKLSGLFLCRREHHVSGLARSWIQPHSRFYGLDQRELCRAGFRIVSSSREVGPDMFTIRRFTEHLFMQGHPEYGFSTLPGEFRRDVERFLRGERDAYPDPPAGYYGRAVQAKLAAFESHARLHRSPEALPAFDAIVGDVTAEHSWRPAALQIYGHWLRRVAALQAPRLAPLWAGNAGHPLAASSSAVGSFAGAPAAR